MARKEYVDLTDRELALARKAHDGGASIRAIADEFQVSKSTMARLLKVQPGKPPERCEVLMPVNVLLPGDDLERCPHGVIRDGDNVYCPRCHQTGRESHHRLRKPTPEVKNASKHKFKPKGVK